jgi:iron complex outermembrane receptor protein
MALAVVALCASVARAQTPQVPVRAVDSNHASPDSAATRPFGGRVIVLDSIAVNSQLAREGRSPTPFTSLSASDIRRDYHGQDLPMLLADTPGAYAYSDAGNGIGYSYLQIRGFPQRRIAVTINGIPLNDPESREVYWIDHPDLAASASEIQVQRGVGATAYGTTALGGSVNVETVPYREDREFRFEAGAGTFGTQRYSVQASSGLLDGRYASTARLSRILTDGYREQSWSNLWSYFLGLTRLDARLTTRLNFYGGPEETHLAYLGVSKDYLDGTITGNAAQDRRFNPLTYPNERDHFFEPHYELLHDFKASDRLALSSALFYFPGQGYYDEFRTDVDLREYNYPDIPSTPDSADVVRRRWVKDIHFGWVPRARYTAGRYEAEGGLDLRYHSGRHWGELLFSSPEPAGPEPNHVYYDYKGITINTSAFVRQRWAFSKQLRATGDLSLHRQRYELRDDALTGYVFTQDYYFVTPRAGLDWIVRERDAGAFKHIEAYASFSRANAEPIFSELYDAEDAGTPPGFATLLPSGELKDPLLKPERVYDSELGLRGRGAWGTATLGGYWMEFQNEIVYNGQLDDLGNPITGNAARSRHAGVEAAWDARLGHGFEVRGAGHWSSDRFHTYHEYVDATTFVDYTGNRIAGFPALSGRLALAYKKGRARLELGTRTNGRQYLDNTENDRLDPAARTTPGYVDKTIAPWATTDAAITWDAHGLFGSHDAEIAVRGDNLFDRRYEAAGYVDFPAPSYNEVPVWIPAATRSIFASLRASF